MAFARNEEVAMNRMSAGRRAAAALLTLTAMGAITTPAKAAALASSVSACQNDFGSKVPVLLVHGFHEGPDVWGAMTKTIQTTLPDVKVVTPFDYPNTKWVNDPDVGPKLATVIRCLATDSKNNGGPGKVVIVAHSMGGLAVRCAVDPTCAGKDAVDQRQIGLVITLGTPNTGATLATTGNVLSTTGVISCEVIVALQTGFNLPCPDLGGWLFGANSQAAQVMATGLDGKPSQDLSALQPLPAKIPLDAIAGQITVATSLFNLGPFPVVSGPQFDLGDLVVPVASALDGAPPTSPPHPGTSSPHPGPGSGTVTIPCGTVSISNLIGPEPESISLHMTCWHLTETTNPVWQSDVVTAIQDYLNLTACTPKALTGALMQANPQLNGFSWKLTASACEGSWAVARVYAPTVGSGTAFLRQTPAGWASAPLGEVNCSDIPGPLGVPLPPQALTVSLLSKAHICASGNANPSPSLPLPDFYYADAVLPEKLYISPTFPKELAIDNHDGIAIQSLNAWDPESMTMTGTLAYDECQPDCGAGPTVTFPVQVIATAPKTCTLQVDQVGSTVPKQAYVYSDITVKVLSGNPPTYLVGNSVFKVCNPAPTQQPPTQQPPTQQSPAPFAVTSSSPTFGPASGGTLIVIHGSGFSSVTDVVMNSIEPPLPEGNPNYFLQNLHPRFSVVSDSEIDVTTTAGAAGFTYEIDFITPTNEYFRNTFPGIPLFTYK